jgi:hypothetical protein
MPPSLMMMETRWPLALLESSLLMALANARADVLAVILSNLPGSVSRAIRSSTMSRLSLSAKIQLQFFIHFQ